MCIINNASEWMNGGEGCTRTWHGQRPCDSFQFLVFQSSAQKSDNLEEETLPGSVIFARFRWLGFNLLKIVLK